jgi:hypothetical protein
MIAGTKEGSMIFRIHNKIVLAVTLIIGCLSMAPNALAQGRYSDPKPSLIISATYVEDGRVIVLLNSRAFWNSNGYLTDTYSDEEQRSVNRIQEEVQLSNLSESTFEPINEEVSLTSIQKALQRSGAPVDRQFQEWVNQEFISAE